MERHMLRLHICTPWRRAQKTLRACVTRPNVLFVCLLVCSTVWQIQPNKSASAVGVLLSCARRTFKTEAQNRHASWYSHSWQQQIQYILGDGISPATTCLFSADHKLRLHLILHNFFLVPILDSTSAWLVHQVCIRLTDQWPFPSACGCLFLENAN